MNEVVRGSGTGEGAQAARALGLAYRIAQRCGGRDRYPADAQGVRDWIAEGAAKVARGLQSPGDGRVGQDTDETRWQLTDAILALQRVPGFGFPELSAVEAGALADRIIAHIERDAIATDGAAESTARDAGGAPRLRLMPRLTRAEMAGNQLRFLCPQARFLPRGVETIVTSLGGVGKTRLALQLLNQLADAEAVFGCELLRPERPMRGLYIGAEDPQPFFNSAAMPLLARDDDKLPFDVILLPEVWPGFTLTPENARGLARFIEGEFHDGLDVVVLDPRVSLVPIEYAELMKNPIIARAFFNECMGPLLASKRFALVSITHDSKVASPVAGSADQQNAARCVLQISTEGPTADGRVALKLERHKDNVGFRFNSLALERDPETLLLAWDESASTYAYGAPPDGKLCARPPTDQAEVRRYLARQAAKLLAPIEAPEECRAKRKFTDRLQGQAAKDGLTKVKEAVRAFVDGWCDFEPRKAGRARRMVLVGVRNPDAALDEHDDFIAGRAGKSIGDEVSE